MAGLLQLVLLAFGALVCIQAVHGDDVILHPPSSDKQAVAMVLIPSLKVDPFEYKSLAVYIQDTCDYSLWVAIPQFPLNLVVYDEIGKAIDRVLLAMQAAGLKPDTPLFLAAHSPLSAIPLEEYLEKNPTLAKNIKGLILLGSFLQRIYRSSPYPVHTLTLTGELDGLARVTRIMEEYYHRIQGASNSTLAIRKFPVVIIRGMSHYQFLSGTSAIPSSFKNYDFRPEISYDVAHTKTAGIVSIYMSVVLGNTSSLSVLEKAVSSTGTFLKPIIEAYKLEASYQFKTPCFENPPSPACQVGCPWTELAMSTMAQLDIGHVNDTDEIHPASEIFPKIHHPAIFTNCSSPSSSCIVKLSSVSENIYTKDTSDDGSIANSAKEIRGKLKSRQSVMIAAGYGNVDFNKSDAGSRCRTVNQQAYDWALKNSDPITLSRFREYGVSMVMGEDKGCLENGGLWIYLPMDYTDGTNSTGGQTLVVQSIQLKTPVTYKIELFAGMHYCKLLSPARAMEWIYVDGLRQYYSLAN